MNDERNNLFKYCRDLELEYLEITDFYRNKSFEEDIVDFYRRYLPSDIIGGIRDMLDNIPNLIGKINQRRGRIGHQIDYRIIGTKLVFFLYFLVYAIPYVTAKTWRWDPRLFHGICNDLGINGFSYPL